MFINPRSKYRPFHWGSFPLESLPRDPSVAANELGRLGQDKTVPCQHAPAGPLADAIRHYIDLYARFVDGDVSPAQAPLPPDCGARTADIKGGAYFMDASSVGVCALDARACREEFAPGSHVTAVVVLVEHPRQPESDNLASGWTQNCVALAAELRAAEIAITVAGHIRNLGFAARAHVAGDSGVDHDLLAVLAGVAIRDGEAICSPFFAHSFACAVVTTQYILEHDSPLAVTAQRADRSLRYWWGINGARSGRERNRQASRATHLSRYPMETVKRVERPTTLILDEEVPRVPKRAAFFTRASFGDLGTKAQREVKRFAYKTPLSASLRHMILAQVPHQDGPVADARLQNLDDPAANSRAIKSLAYFLGADLTGICEVPRYAWYSHHLDGTDIEPYHRYAVVMLIDQGFDTMEAASGDDWMSGAQSMRGYLRGAQMAGVMAEMLRASGISARPQTNADSDVLQIPLVLLAGLGEMSRIGELVLNPFVGPRFKSVVLTTDLPLEADKPIDFGLQAFCNHCLKCARECPCDAIPFGPKVMFNGYETWKPDVERCTRYRVTNQKGSACGRCMKTCPINKVVDADAALLTRVASWLGINAMWLKPLLVPIAARMDDMLGNGRRNLVKKWWFDHEMVDGRAVIPKATNERDLDASRKVDRNARDVAFYHANVMPPPDATTPVKLNRKAALHAAQVLETPEAAKSRVLAGREAPEHYRATPVLNSSLPGDKQ